MSDNLIQPDSQERELLDRLLESCTDAVQVRASEAGYASAVDIRWSRRLTSSAGYWHYRNGGAREWITLSEPIFLHQMREEGPQKCAVMLAWTIAHEVAHHIAYREYGDNCHHDRRWKHVMHLLGFKADRTHDMPTLSAMIPGEVREAFPLGGRVMIWWEGGPIKPRVRSYNANTISFDVQHSHQAERIRIEYKDAMKAKEDLLALVGLAVDAVGVKEMRPRCIYCSSTEVVGELQEDNLSPVCAECSTDRPIDRQPQAEGTYDGMDGMA